MVHGYIPSVSAQTYPIIAYAEFPLLVGELHTSGTITATTSPAEGELIAVGETLGLVVTAGSGAVSFTIGMKRA